MISNVKITGKRVEYATDAQVISEYIDDDENRNYRYHQLKSVEGCFNPDTLATRQVSYLEHIRKVLEKKNGVRHSGRG